MTRINVVPPAELVDMHLLAEYRELPRTFKLATAFFNAGKKHDFPVNYTLGTGHVKFFYSRLTFLAKRQVQLVEELKKRGFNITFNSGMSLLDDCPAEFCNDWQPTEEAMRINRERIALRLSEFEAKRALKKSGPIGTIV